MRAQDLLITPMGALFAGRRLPCTLGRTGTIPADAKREGDGASPQGVHRIVGMLYRADRLAAPAAWAVPIGPRDLWSDDSRDPFYNQKVRAPHAFSHEVLRRADRLYDLVLLTDWNTPDATPGRGSAIFLHRWRGPCHPTAGCVAFAPADLLWLCRRLRLGTRLILRRG